MLLWRRKVGGLAGNGLAEESAAFERPDAPLYRDGLSESPAAPFRHDDLSPSASTPFRHAGPSGSAPRFELAEAPLSFGRDEGPVWRLGLEDYRSAGGLAALLSHHADEVLAKAAPDAAREKLVEHLFRALTDINAEGQATRRPRTFAELMAVTGGDEQTLRNIIGHFRAEGVFFLTPYGDAPIEPGTLIDISHEALIRCWQKIADKEEGWLQREFRDGLIWKTLRMQAQRGETLSAVATEARDAWLRTLPSPAWAERYDDAWDDVQQLMFASRMARDEQVQRQRQFEESRRREAEERARRVEEARQAAKLATKQQELHAAQGRIAEEQRRRADDAIASQKRQRRWTMAALGTAVIAMVAAAYAWTQRDAAEEQRQRAEQAVIEAKAASLWNELQLWNDPLKPRDVATLWNLTQTDDSVRVAFVRQLAGNPELLAQFGFRPGPISRAVGLVWPDEAREIITQSVAYVASDQFDLKRAQPFELVSYTRVLAALAQWLDPATVESGTQKIANTINNLAGARQLTDQQLWALAEMVGVFAERFGWELIEPALKRLREIIASAEPSGSAGWRGQALSRAIEVMAPTLTTEERSRAVQHLVPLLGQNTDSWAAKAVPRAMTALLPTLDADQAVEMLNAVPPAIATSASAAASNNDSSYLLTLMQVLEKVARMDDDAAVAALGQALINQFAEDNDPLARAALARAAIPLLTRLHAARGAINRQVAAITLVPESAAPAQRAYLRQDALKKAEDTLRQAVFSSDEEQKKRQSEAALQILHAEWSAEPSPTVRVNSYRRAAQARLVALLAPSLSQVSVVLAAADLLGLLPGTQDYLAREAIARALAALAPKLPEAQREEALAAAKSGLARTGATEEATAWAHAIAALLPDDPRAATAEIVEALKYPTATGAATGVLLAALAKPWPEEFRTIAGRTVADANVLDWLEARLPEGQSLTESRQLPPAPPSEGAGPGPG